MWHCGTGINYQLILFQANLLSCLSTIMGLVHESPLPNGVVNLWQPNSGAQCGAYGWWTELYPHRYNTQLLDDIASHPPLRRHQHHHQLTHVGWLAADTRSHMKNDFSQQKNISECTTFAVWLTGWHEAVLATITHHNRAGGLCPVNSGGHCSLCSHNPLCSQGNMKTMRNPTARREVPRSSQDRLET